MSADIVAIIALLAGVFLGYKSGREMAARPPPDPWRPPSAPRDPLADGLAKTFRSRLEIENACRRACGVK